MTVAPAVLVISAVTDDLSEATQAARVGTPGWYVVSACVYLLVGSLVVATVAPSAALLLAAFLATVLVALPESIAGDDLFLAVPAVALVVLAAVDTLGRRRRRSLLRAWRQEATAATVVPDVPQPLRVQLTRRRWGLLIVAWIGAVIGLLGFIVLARDVVATAAFRDNSIVALTTVDSVTQDEKAVRVTIDGQSYRVPVSPVPPAGSLIEVRYQPRSGRAEATDDVFDPTTALLPAVIGSVVAATFFILARVRRRESAAFLTDGGLAFQVRAVGNPPSRRVLLYAMDEPRRPVAVAKELQTWFGPLPASVQPDPAGARVDVLPPHLEAWGGQPWAPQPSDPLRGPVTVVGFGRFDGPAALLDSDGRWWVIRGGLRRPRRSDRPAPPSGAGDGWVR